MLEAHLALKYAQALFELAQENNMLDQVQQELAMVDETVTQYPDLGKLLYHPLVPAAVKKDTVQKIFAASVHEYVLHFLLLLVDKRRENYLSSIYHTFLNLVDEAKNIVTAQAVAALPLSTAQVQALQDRLSAVTGRQIRLEVSVDPRLIGGVAVKLGDKLIDGSVRRRLRTLEQALLREQATRMEVTP